jgi:hypothetical protein
MTQHTHFDFAKLHESKRYKILIGRSSHTRSRW